MNVGELLWFVVIVSFGVAFASEAGRHLGWWAYPVFSLIGAGIPLGVLVLLNRPWKRK